MNVPYPNVAKFTLRYLHYWGEANTNDMNGIDVSKLEPDPSKWDWSPLLREAHEEGEQYYVPDLDQYLVGVSEQTLEAYAEHYHNWPQERSKDSEWYDSLLLWVDDIIDGDYNRLWMKKD